MIYIFPSVYIEHIETEERKETRSIIKERFFVYERLKKRKNTYYWKYTYWNFCIVNNEKFKNLKRENKFKFWIIYIYSVQRLDYSKIKSESKILYTCWMVK